MRFRVLVCALALFVIAGFILFKAGDVKKPPRTTENVVQANPAAAANTQADAHNNAPSAVEKPDPDDPRIHRLPDGRVEYKAALESSRLINNTSVPEETILAVGELFAHFRYVYKENPVGVENFEITEQLLGNNPKRIVFIAKDSPALRGNELVDKWGTPFFFHPLSAEKMEVRSAGPDKKFWSEDDIFLDQF